MNDITVEHDEDVTIVTMNQPRRHVRPRPDPRRGDYALLSREPHAHLERGGPTGGLAFFGCHTDNGRLYEIVDDDGAVLLDITIDLLVADFTSTLETT